MMKRQNSPDWEYPNMRQAKLENPAYQVTAVLPVYNGAAQIRRAIESVLTQSYAVAELIVVDDGSTDGTADIVRSYEPSVRYLYQSNSGVAAARNRGLREATTEWIAFLDHDDQWLPDKLERQVSALQTKPESRLCYSAQWLHLLDGTKEYHYLPPDELWPAARMRNPFPPSVVLLHKREALEIGGFDERLKGASCEDWDFFIRFLAAYPVVGVPEPLTNYFIELSSGSRNYQLMIQNTLTITETSLLAGLSGLRRAIWRRRIKSTLYYRVAISAREWGDPALGFAIQSLCQWPLPGGPNQRFRTLLAELRDRAARQFRR
jgi:glycosyltransferase involved in cell wall biosynthesis